MNTLCTLFNNLCKNNVLKCEVLDDLEKLITSVVKDGLKTDANFVKSVDAFTKIHYLDFTYWLTPDWLDNTADNKQVRLCFSIDTHIQVLDATAIIYSQDGELKDWGYVSLTSGELEKFAYQAILSKIKTQYDKKVMKENAKQCKDIGKAIKVLDLLAPHVKKINEICKKHKVTLYSDHSLDGTNCIYVVPNTIEMGEPKDGEKVIGYEQLPYIDLNARGFDPGYDSFILTK